MTTVIKDDFHKQMRHVENLFKLINNHDVNGFLQYISSSDDVNVNIKDRHGNYLINLAVAMNNIPIIKKLIDAGCRLDILDIDGYSILYVPIKFSFIEVIDTLIEYNKMAIGFSLVNLKDVNNNSPIFYAIKFHNYEVLQILLQNGADANYKNNDAMNALHYAILKRDVTAVKMIIDYIKNLDTRSKFGFTPLHYACILQLIDIVKLLLDHHANPNIIEYEYDFYPIFYSVVHNNIEITKLLINVSTNPNHQDYLGNTIIHYTILEHHYAILDYIFNYYTVNNTRHNVYTEDINTRDIVDKFIDPNIVNIDGLTIVHLLLYLYTTTYNKYIKLVLPLARLNYQDNTGNTIMHIMVEKNLWHDYIPYLQRKKINIYIRNNAGRTIMDMVLVKDHDKFVDMISQSYYNYLQKHENNWLLKWQNKCSHSELDERKCLQYIKSDIINRKMSIPMKINKRLIIIEQNEIVNNTTFTGSLLDVICGYKYLVMRHQHTATLFSPSLSSSDTVNHSLEITDNPHQYIINFEIRWIYQKLYFPVEIETVIANIINSKDARYIIIPIGIILSNGNHSNSLYYDIAEQTLERFEPHGSGYPYKFNYNPDFFDELLHNKFNSMLSNIYQKKLTVKYYRPKRYLPKIGFQTFENIEMNINKNIGDPNGFCAVWCIWYLDYRLQYPALKPYTIIKNLMTDIKMNHYSYRTIIRNYSKKITDLRDNFLTRINRTINDYLDDKFTKDDITRLIAIINS